jgi:hypothetical protein
MNASGEIIELHNFNGYYYQRWKVMHQWNGYYRIESTYSDLVLTAPTGSGNSVVTQTSYSSQDAQVWKFIEQSDGTYKISPKSNSSCFLYAGDYSLYADQDVEIQGEQNNNRNKWNLRRYNGNVQLEAQQQNKWCWVACARMAAMRFVDPLMSQASAAVYLKLNMFTHNPTAEQIDLANDTGSILEIEQAIECFSGISATYSSDGNIYSSEVLRSLLDQSNIVIACRAKYDGLIRQPGHAIVIYGYHWDANESMYVYDIFDPAPVNSGSSYSSSYENICNSSVQKHSADQVGEEQIWDRIVTYRIGDYDNVISAPTP